MRSTTALLLTSLAAAMTVTCDREPPITTEVDMAPAPPPIETRRGLPLALGQHATPALEKLARECLRPDDLQIAALLVSRREPVNLEHFAIAVGERLPDEEFARAKALERVQARLDEVRRELDRRTLCLEMDVIIDRYDFDRERFVFGSDVATLIMADPTGHADSQRQRLTHAPHMP